MQINYRIHIMIPLLRSIDVVSPASHEKDFDAPCIHDTNQTGHNAVNCTHAHMSTYIQRSRVKWQATKALKRTKTSLPIGVPFLGL